MKKRTDYFIFLFDAIGAFVSGISMFVLSFFSEWIGLPKGVLMLFMGIAFLFGVYSACIYVLKPKRWSFFLKIIASLNVGYCLITVYQLFQHQYTLSFLGSLYFGAEILIIVGLALYETVLAKKQARLE
jgi:hypothetical protein